MPDFNQMQRRRLASRNQAMPDGSFPIRNISDLKNAIQSYGRAKNKTAAMAWIKKRARELDAEYLLPESWVTSAIEQSDFVRHYGIKGQRWGIRRFQNEDGSLTSQGKKRYSETSNKNGTDSKSDESKDRFWTDSRKRTAKRVAIGVGIAAAVVGGAVLYRYLKTPQGQQTVDKGMKFLQEKLKLNKPTMQEAVKERYGDKAEELFDSKLGLFKKANPMSIKEDLKAVNLREFKKKKGASSNCTFCTTAYELRRRGYDVVANYTEGGRTVKHASSFFKNPVIENDGDVVKIASEAIKEYKKQVLSGAMDIPEAERKIKSVYTDSLRSALEKQGEGARGNFIVNFTSGGAHSMIYEIENGKLRLRDAQTGVEQYDIDRLISMIIPGKTEWFRTDNLEINPDTIREAVTNFGTTRVERNAIEYDSILARSYRQRVVELVKNDNMSIAEARKYVREKYGVSV